MRNLKLKIWAVAVFSPVVAVAVYLESASAATVVAPAAQLHIVCEANLSQSSHSSGFTDQEFKVFYEKFYRLVRAKIWNFGVRDQSEAEDFAQDVFLKLFINGKRVKDAEEDEQRAYVYSVTKSVLIDFTRRKKNRVRENFVSYDSSADEAGSESWIENLLGLSRDMNPQEKVLAEERTKLLRRAMVVLSDEMHEVLSLFYFDQLKYEEIALVQGIPLGTVRSRISRGSKILKEKILSDPRFTSLRSR